MAGAADGGEVETVLGFELSELDGCECRVEVEFVGFDAGEFGGDFLEVFGEGLVGLWGDA